MALSPRLSPLSLPIAFAALFVVSSLVIHAAAPADPARITAVANVTLRAMPSVSSPPVAQIPLGTEVAEAGPTGLDKTWLRVRLADGTEGWVTANLTRPLDPVWRWPVFDRIIAERLGRKGDGFSASAELVAFIERVAPEYTDADGRARIELARLRALATTLRSIPFRGERRAPFAEWLAARKHDVTYDEPGGHWMPAPAKIWEVHARHRTTETGDDIAWFAVTNGLPGECEGHLACYLGARNHLEGEYLRRHPAGRRAAEAIGEIKRTADLLAARAKPRSGFQFERARDCRDLTAAVEGLISAVKDSRVETRDAAIGSLDGLKQMCQAPAFQP